MKYARFIIICLTLLSGSCSKDVIERQPSAENFDDIIGWKVITENISEGLNPDTRALIEDYDDLRKACTALEGQEAEKIGLLGNYILDGVSKVVFDNTDLWWWEKEEGNPYPDYLGEDSYWNYPGEDVYWTSNADYTFKAYFPKSKVELQPGSGPDKLLIVYDTETTQYDLLVAHKEMLAKSENPVKLVMNNALSALSFDFQFVETGVSDELLCCWLENNSDNGLYTSSTLNFEDDIVWPQSTPNPAGSPFYYWEPEKPLEIRSNYASVAYSTSATDGNGSIYTDNFGWLLIIPQSNTNAGAAKLCFKTSTGGSTVYSIDFPAFDFKAGNRYRYHVKMTSTGIELSLTIADWNERKSSHEIDFND